MTRNLTLAICLLATVASAEAQWTTDVSVNTTVRADTTGEAVTPLTTEGPDGSTYISWFENPTGEYQLRMQRLDAAGNRLWPDTGLVVSSFPQNSAIFRYDLQSDENENAIVAFQDERTGNLDIVAYKIGPDGSFLWGLDGVQLPTPGTTGLSPVVAALSNGNTAIAWSTNDSPGQVAVQLVGPSGTQLLATPVLISASTRVSRPKLIATHDGGFILQYVVSNGSFGIPPGTMYAQRYAANGTAVWPNTVQVSSKPVAFFYFPEPVSDGHDGFFLAYNTGNPDNASFTDVYVQRVRANGTLWSVDGTRTDNSATIQKFTAGKGLALLGDEEGMMVPLQITDGAQGQSGVAVQRLDTAGVRQLGDFAATVIPISSNYVAPWDASATEDGAVIAHVSGTFGEQHIAATRVNLAGIPAWSPAQRDISTANSNKDDVQATEMEDGRVVVVWQDDRNPNGIYAQSIDSLDISTGVAHISTSEDHVRLEQNPADAPALLLPPTFRGGAEVEVFGAQGKLAYAGRLNGGSRVQLPLGGLPHGLYSIRVIANGSTAVVRWVH